MGLTPSQFAPSDFKLPFYYNSAYEQGPEFRCQKMIKLGGEKLLKIVVNRWHLGA